MSRRNLTGWLAAAALLASLPGAAPAAGLQGAFERALQEGVQSYREGSYELARDRFRDARLARPRAPEPVFNLGLAEARLGNHDAAEALFREALELSGEDARLRADAWYNLARTQLDAAQAAVADPENPDRQRAVDKGLGALDSVNNALAAQPAFPEAEFNRGQIQNFLQMLAEAAPPEQQPSDGEGESEQQEQQQQEGEQPPPQGDQDGAESDQQDSQSESSQDGEGGQSDSTEQGDDQQQPPEGQPGQGDEGQEQEPRAPEYQDPSDEQGDQPQGERPQPQPGEEQGEESDGQPQGAGADPGDRQPPKPMTPEEAKAMLNLLGNREFVPMRDGRRVVVTPETKTW